VSKCDTCGTELINRCWQCGAPICCPKCCNEATAEHYRLAEIERLAASQPPAHREKQTRGGV
jgi:hypothetical protein